MIQGAKTQEERTESIDRLYEDIRRALNGRDYTRAARLSLQLYAEIADDEAVRAMQYPVCLECNGYAEVVDPKHPELKVACRTAPAVCPGNQNGRMAPESFRAYLDAKLEPTRATLVDTMQHPTVPGGEVPKLPDDGMRPTPPPTQEALDAERAARIARQNTGGAGVEESEEGKTRPEMIQS
jgi:hypothetical protein